MINKKHVPCIAGSTGLVGSHLLKNLSNLYPKVISLTREEVNYSNPNIQNVIVNFDDLNINSVLKEGFGPTMQRLSVGITLSGL